MACDPIVLYTVAEGEVFAGREEDVRALGEDPERLVTLSQGEIRRHEVYLYTPITYAMQLTVERLIRKPDPRGGVIEDPLLRPQAMVEAYIERWTFAPPPSARGFLQLHPNVAACLFPALLDRVFPSQVNCPWFFDHIKHQAQAALDVIRGTGLGEICITWDELHPGILAYIHDLTQARNGGTIFRPYANSLMEMHPEDAMVYLTLLRHDMQGSPQVTASHDAVETHHQRLLERLTPRT